jgi:hypothetical protein
MTGGAGDGEDGPERLQVPVGILSVAALVTAFHRAVPQIYALNFDTASPGPTASMVLLLVTAWTLPLARRGRLLDPSTGRPGLTAAAGGAALAASLVPNAIVAVLAGLAVWPLLTPALAMLSQTLGRRVGIVLAGGVLLHQALRVGTGGAPLAGSTLGRALLLGLAGATAGAWLGLRSAGPEAGTAEGLAWGLGPVWAALLAEAAFLGSAEAPAAWWGGSRLAVAVASAVGLAAAAVAVARGRAPTPRGTLLWAGLLAVAGADLAAGGLLGPGSVLLAQVALVLVVAGAAAAPTGRGRRPTAWGVAGAQVGAVVLVLGLAWAGNWAFVPAGDLFRGRAPAILALLLAWPAFVAAPAAVERWEA